MITVYKDYEVEIKMVQEQLGGRGGLTFGGGIEI